jgi:hypothetical protein
MASRIVECLNCGATRRITELPLRLKALHDCARCGYVGWAETESLTEALRRALRDSSPEQRRRAAAW